MALSAESFVAGAIGEPGNRTFLLQFVVAGTPIWYVLEKAQVAVLATETVSLLAAAGQADAGATVETPELEEPTHIAFRVAEIGLVYDQDMGLVSLLLTPTDEDLEPAAYLLSPGQLDAGARAGGRAVAGGRPRCPRCGLAMDPDGHNCPVTNGDLRHHRP
jgi:uncharacterized repeat protein (TIGR03847 family)